MSDSGHSHGPNAYFVTDCPLCDAAKNARNQAIDHLTEALYLFNGIRPEGEQPTLRLNLGPVNVTGDDVGRCHSFDLSAKQAEALVDAIDSMTPHAMQDIPVDRERLARKGAELAAWMEGQSGETIASGEWSAAAVAQNSTDTWDAVNDVFDQLNPTAITRQVLNEAHADNLSVNRALDAWFGDIPDPDLADLYGDEDGDA